MSWGRRFCPCSSSAISGHLASAAGVGPVRWPFVTFRGTNVEVALAGPDSFTGIDLVLASAGATVTKELAPFIRKSGAILIDNSSAFRMDPDVPLVVPEINGDAVKLGTTASSPTPTAWRS